MKWQWVLFLSALAVGPAPAQETPPAPQPAPLGLSDLSADPRTVVAAPAQQFIEWLPTWHAPDLSHESLDTVMSGLN